MSILDLLRGPRLYTKFHAPMRDSNIVESFSDQMFTFARGLGHFITGFSPIVFGYMYSRGMLSPAYLGFFLKYITVYATVAYSTRLIGRMLDTEYRTFLDVWSKAQASQKTEDIQALKQYDFEIAGGPVDFHAKPKSEAWYLEPDMEDLNVSPIVKGIAYLCVHSFGRRMLYPGSVSLLNYMLSSTIQENRKMMITLKQGQRAWLKSATGDTIDSVFIDQRGKADKGRFLVICCEGNAGFYEIGIANTPGQLGYSVLGWNTPGFAESSGTPLPENIFAAADAVMQYATGPLGFTPDKVILFGWSIGGYPASWLAANHPQIRALVLDATFDDVLPLAVSRMPSFAGGIVSYAIRAHLNLGIAKQVAVYKGPLRLIRRLQEEIILTDEMGTEEERRASNRANFLLKAVLEQRHPSVLKGLEPQVDRWLAMTPEQRIVAGSLVSSADSIRIRRLFSLCEHYIVDFDANHVTPLSPFYFNIPDPLLGN